VIMRTPTYPLGVPITRLKKSRNSDPLLHRTQSARNSPYATSPYPTAAGLSLEKFMVKNVFNCKCCRNSLYSQPEPAEQVTGSEGSVQPAEPEENESLCHLAYDQQAFEAAWRRHAIEREGSGTAAAEQPDLTAMTSVSLRGWMKKVIGKAFSARKRGLAEN
ncbi:hypothetical protein FRC00_007106, partial [Tulasnella sp. 408]